MSSNRRTFLAGTAATAITATGSQAVRAAAPSSPKPKVRLGVIGCGGRGRGLIASFAELSDVEIVAVCDPDQSRAGQAAERTRGRPRAVADLRRVLDDKSIDGVVVATPDHWHAPAAILALDAGKHVYVEKPCSHNVREGRLLVEAARRNKRHVQHGTQSRSAGLIGRAVQALREGLIGEVLVAKAWNVQRRGEIGRGKPTSPPAGFDYDLWVGPAPMAPFQANRHHYTWHWWYDFGTGDTGNDGVHELDIARWGLGVTTHPNRVSAIGGKLSFDDDQQFPDTQYASFEYPDEGKQGKQLVFEMRLWSRYGLEGVDNGNAFYGSRGWMLLSKRGILKAFDERNRPLEITTETPQWSSHYQNFVDTIRGDDRLRAEIEVGHRSATLCHLANIATRLRRTVEFDPKTERTADVDAALLLTRKYREGHWAVPKT